MNKKKKGTRREYQSMELIRSLGYHCIRSSASRSPFDIVCFSEEDIILLQIKSGKWPSQVEVQQMRAFPSPTFVKKQIHRWQNRKKKPDVRVIE